MYQTVELTNYGGDIEIGNNIDDNIRISDEVIAKEFEAEELTNYDNPMETNDVALAPSDDIEAVARSHHPSMSGSPCKIESNEVFVTNPKVFFGKFFGVEGKRCPERLAMKEITYSSIISFIGIFTICVIDHFYLSVTFQTPSHTDVVMLTGAFAASAVLIYDLHFSPYSQPRNVLGSHILSSFIGVCIRMGGNALGIPQFVLAPFAVGCAIFFMNLALCVHPPGGATAILAVIGGPAIQNLGFGYVLTCAGGALISIVVASITNNFFSTRQYPMYWI